MKKPNGVASLSRDQAHELRAELARKIALFIGSAENRATEIPGLTLHRRTAPTAPCSMTYEPGVTVIAQGRKRVDLGRTTVVYDPSQFLLTSVDLPVVSRVIEASEKGALPGVVAETRNARGPRTSQQGGHFARQALRHWSRSVMAREPARTTGLPELVP
jgi:hypothetical protein